MPEFQEAATDSFRPIPLLEKDSDSYSIRLEADPAGMEARGYIFPKKTGNIINILEVAEMLSSSKVAHGLDSNAIKLFCGIACSGIAQQSVVLAKATPPIHGEDEHVDFAAHPNSDRRKFEAMDADRLLGESMPLIECVQTGDVIGRIVPPKKGVPGTNIFGVRIPAANGVPMPSYPLAGQNVRWLQESRSYEAASPGRVILERDALSVSDKYLLTGDVGARTGNIDFIGDIEITGGVHDGFSVKARNIRLRGVAGECQLESSGDMDIGGMSGNYVGAIRCGGNLSARFLIACSVEARGNIEVRNEIVNSVVKSGGAIYAATGRIEGGECVALCGIEAINIGSPKGSRTIVTAGTCPFTEREIRRAAREFNRKAKKISRIRRMIAPFTYAPERIKRLKEAELAAFKRLASEYNQLSKDASKIKRHAENLQMELAAKANPMINVKGMIMRGVVISLGHTAQEIGMPVRSPVSIIENPSKRMLRFTRLRSLSEKARDIASEMDGSELQGTPS